MSEQQDAGEAWVVDDYTQGLRVERALAHLEAIADPIARVRAANDLAEQARDVQSEIGQIRHRAIYEATLRPGHTGESVAAELDVSPKAVSLAVSKFRRQDRELFRAALEILTREGITDIVEQLLPGLRARDVLVQARLVLLGHQHYSVTNLSDAEFELVLRAEKRARAIHRSTAAASASSWHRASDQTKIHWDHVPASMHNIAKTFDVLPGIVPIFFDGPDEVTTTASGLWRVGWTFLSAEDGASLFDAGPHRDGWATTEYLAWFVRDLGRGDYPIWTSMTAPPPFLNEPGDCLVFIIEGDARGDKAITPNEFVRRLKHLWADERTGFMEVDWPALEVADGEAS